MSNWPEMADGLNGKNNQSFYRHTAQLLPKFERHCVGRRTLAKVVRCPRNPVRECGVHICGDRRRRRRDARRPHDRRCSPPKKRSICRLTDTSVIGPTAASASAAGSRSTSVDAVQRERERERPIFPVSIGVIDGRRGRHHSPLGVRRSARRPVAPDRRRRSCE